MEKPTEGELNDLIAFWAHVGRYPNHDDILACLLELKQLRAEKKCNGNGD
jgi:hypothetical protein